MNGLKNVLLTHDRVLFSHEEEFCYYSKMDGTGGYFK